MSRPISLQGAAAGRGSRRDQRGRGPPRARSRLRAGAAGGGAARRCRGLQRIIGLDVSYRALQGAARRLHLDTMAPGSAAGSSCCRARSPTATAAERFRRRRRRRGDRASRPAAARGLSSEPSSPMRSPALVVLTTPNAEYNAAVRRPARPGACATGTTASSGRGPVRPVVSQRRRPVRLPGRAVRDRARRPGPGSPTQLAVFRDDGHQDPGTLAGGPGRRHRVRQVDLRGAALPAHRGHLVGLLPGAGQRRSRTTSRPPATPSRCCTSSRASGWRPAGSPWWTRPTSRPAARQSLIELAAKHHVLAVAIVLDVPAEVCAARNAGRAGPDVRRPRAAPAAGPAPPRPARPAQGGVPPGVTCCPGEAEIAAAVLRARAALERPRIRPRAIRHHR